MSRHSNDLRQRVVDYFNKGNLKTVTARTFKISRQTLDNWLELDKQGKLTEVKQYHRGFESKVNLSELKDYVDRHPDEYYHEIAEQFGIKREQARVLVKRLNYTVKKNKPFTKKQMKNKDQSSSKKSLA